MDIPKATLDGLRKKHGRIFASTIRLPSGNELGVCLAAARDGGLDDQRGS